MKTKDLALAVLAVFLVLWLGGSVLGMFRYFMHMAIRIVALVAVVAIIVHLASARRY